MGNLNFSKIQEDEARKAIKHLINLFKDKKVHEDHLVLYQFMILCGTMFLDKKEALSLVLQMQDIFEPDRTMN